MNDFIFMIVVSNIIILVVITFLIYKNNSFENEKRIKKIYNEINGKIADIDVKFYFEITDGIISNIKSEELETIKMKIKRDEIHYQDYRIETFKDIIMLKSETDRREIAKIKSKYDDSIKEFEKLKDKEYYFYKEFIEKLTYILNEINEFHREIKDITNMNIKFKVENLKDKVEFLLEFFKEKGNVELHRYKLYKIKNLVDMLKDEFDGKLLIDFKVDSSAVSYYIEIDKIFAELKAVFYSVLKLKIAEQEKNISLTIKAEDGFLRFIIKNNASNFSFLKLIDEEFLFVDQIKEQKWKFMLDDSTVDIEVPIKTFEGEQTEEIKAMAIVSNLDNIKDVIKMVLYDMNKYGFNNEEIYDMRLTLDELMVNAIEHGNKFDELKKVHVNYKFINDGKKVAIEIEDEGEGFRIEDIKEPDILSMRGRGISIIKKLVDDIKYSNQGRKVAIIKEKEV